MSEENQLIIFVLLWIITSGVIITKNWSDKSVSSGLSVMYVAVFTALHFMGALIFIFPWYWYGDLRSTLDGFRVSTYGLVTFGIGNLLLGPYLMRLFYLSPSNNPLNSVNEQIKKDSNAPATIYYFLGLFSYFVLNYLFRDVPTLHALVSVGQQLMLVGVCIGLYISWRNGEKIDFIAWLVISLTFPFITIILQGFLGYGAVMTLISLLFVSRFYKSKLKLLIFGLLAIYVGLTFYETYKRDRPELRSLIWGKAPISERIDGLNDSLMNTEWFNPFDSVQLNRIEDRLNQNFLVGVAVKRLQRHGNYAYGKTIWDSFLALVPRILWKDKSVFAGSGNIVSEYTGIKFAKGTSVGVGQVLEFYVNFGTPGVLVGFLLFGILIRIFDFMSGIHLLKRNWQKFTLWFLPGLALLNVGGSLVEVTGTIGASVVVASLAMRLPLRMNRLFIYGACLFILLLGIKFLIVPAIRPISSQILIISLILFSIIFLLRYLSPIFRKKVEFRRWPIK